MDAKLKPCPFCGGKAIRHDIEAREDADNAGASYIECTGCGACTQLHFDRKENLVDSWNRRNAELSRLRDALEPFAKVAEHDIGEDETDDDLFRPMMQNNHAPRLTVGDLRRARTALNESREGE